MSVKERHFVKFSSPGSFFSEDSLCEIERWDPSLAVKMSHNITERYGAKPYGFIFETKLVSDPIPDGRGDFLEVIPKTIHSSGTYFIEGVIATLDELEKRDDPDEGTLRSNMMYNDYPIVCIVTNGFKSIHPFKESDFIVDAKGDITDRGVYTKYRKYRKQKIAECKRKIEDLIAHG